MYNIHLSSNINISVLFLGGLFGGGGKTEDAVEMFSRAANLFKMAKKWGDAGKTFTRIADLHKKVKVCMYIESKFFAILFSIQKAYLNIDIDLLGQK